VEMSAVSLKDNQGNLLGFAAILRDISKRKQIEKKLKDVLFEQEIINKTILRVSRLKEIDSICDILANAVHSLNKECYIGVSFINWDLKSIKMRSVRGLGEARDGILQKAFQYSKDLSIKLIDIKGNGTDIYTSGKLELIPGGLYTLCATILPKKVCKEIEINLNIEKTFYIGFSKNKNPIGGIIISVPKGEEISHPQAIETLANHVSALLLQREAEEKLKKSEKKYRKLYETMRDAYVKIDINGKILETNKEFRDMVGYTSEGIRETTYWDLTSDNTKHAEIKIFKEQLINKGYSEVYEKEFIKNNGRKIPVEVRISLLEDESGKPTGMWALCRDITERKKAKKDLLRSQKQYQEAYEKANFYKDLLAHDIANILNKIGMSVDYADLQKNEDNFHDIIEDLIESIKSHVKEAKELINRIRKISKIRKEDLNLITIDILTLLNKILKENSFFQREEVSVSIQQLTDNKDVIAGPFLRDVFENILLNALQHNESENPFVEIKIIDYDKNFLKFEFIDNARGIPDILKEKIFNPNYKSKYESSGMGIGLSLVNTIVNAYNGKIWVKDRVEGDYQKGSIFSMLLPKA
ncbi:MAG: PAS domain-containing sensor histidine kinase, partial [Promethearchaeota archaeon]